MPPEGEGSPAPPYVVVYWTYNNEACVIVCDDKADADRWHRILSLKVDGLHDNHPAIYRLHEECLP